MIRGEIKDISENETLLNDTKTLSSMGNYSFEHDPRQQNSLGRNLAVETISFDLTRSWLSHFFGFDFA